MFIFLTILIVIMIETSISKIKNIITTMMKLVEKFIFLALMFINPHSNLVFSSFFICLLSLIMQNSPTSVLAITALIPLATISVIDLIFFNWKLNVKLILFSLISLISRWISIGKVTLRRQNVSIMLLFRMSYGALWLLLSLPC